MLWGSIQHLALRHMVCIEATVGTGVGPLSAIWVAAVQQARSRLPHQGDMGGFNEKASVRLLPYACTLLPSLAHQAFFVLFARSCARSTLSSAANTRTVWGASAPMVPFWS